MKDFNIFQELISRKGLELCTRKLYNLKGGDIRHVLDLCRVAIQKKINSVKEKGISDFKISF